MKPGTFSTSTCIHTLYTTCGRLYTDHSEKYRYASLQIMRCPNIHPKKSEFHSLPAAGPSWSWLVLQVFQMTSWPLQQGWQRVFLQVSTEQHWEQWYEDFVYMCRVMWTSGDFLSDLTNMDKWAVYTTFSFPHCLCYGTLNVELSETGVGVICVDFYMHN